MGVTPYLAKALLDWSLGGAAAPTQPAARWVQWATASPTTASAFDGPFTSRASFNAPAAASPTGSATNRSAMSGTATASATALGWNLYDSVANGTRLMFGTLSSSIGCANLDNPTFAAGSLKITLA